MLRSSFTVFSKLMTDAAVELNHAHSHDVEHHLVHKACLRAIQVFSNVVDGLMGKLFKFIVSKLN